MTYTLNAPFGVGGPVNATTSTVNTDFGAKNFPNSPNFSTGRSSTATDLLTANSRNLGTKPPTP